MGKWWKDGPSRLAMDDREPATRCRIFDELDAAGDMPALELAAPAPKAAERRSQAPKKKQVSVDERARRLAAHPPVAESPLAAMGYAWKVGKRLRELRGLCAEAEERYEHARGRAEKLRTELGAAIHRMGSPELGPLVAAVDGAASTAEEREAQLSEMRETAAHERARHARELATLERELEPWREREIEAAKAVEQLEAQLLAARGALAKVETEMAPAAGDPAALAPFEAAYEARKGEVTLARSKLQERRAELQEARKHIGRIRPKVEAITAERERVDRELREAEATAEAASGDAAAQRALALRKLAREALERGLVPDDLPEGPRAHRATETEAQLALEVAIHAAALSVHDQETLARGALYASSVGAGVVGAVFLLLVL